MQKKYHSFVIGAALVIGSAMSPVASAELSESGNQSCIDMAASNYHVSADQIKAIINNNKEHPSGIGVMGIDPQWVPYLSKYGIDVNKIAENSCQNIVAGAWILACAKQATTIEARYRNPANLSKRAKSWQFAVKYYAKESGIPAELINAVIHQESGFNENARSRSGAIGLMQLMPKTAKALGVNPYDPIDNLRGGVAYLRDLSIQFKGNVPLILAGYNAGPDAVRKYGGVPPFSETRAYVQSIMARYEGRQTGTD
jgi:membrane-bound lytic murein transglycosylase B